MISSPVVAWTDATAQQYNDLRQDVMNIGFQGITNCVYDWSGNLTSFDEGAVTYTLTYTAANAVETVTDGTNTWTLTYDSLGRFTGLVES